MVLTPGTGRQQCPQYRGTKIKYTLPRGPEVSPLLCARIKQTGSGNITDADLSLDYSQSLQKRLSSPGSGPRLTPGDGPCFRDQKPTKKIPLHTLSGQTIPVFTHFYCYTNTWGHLNVDFEPIHYHTSNRQYRVCRSTRTLLTRTDVVSLIQKTVGIINLE